MSSSSLRSFALIGILAIGLSGCSVIENIFPAQAERDDETNEVKEAGEADVFTMAVGDCLNDQDADVVETIPAVPCTEPHDFEAYYSFDLTGEGEYPGLETIEGEADQGCYDAFPAFVGIAYEDSALDYSYFYPTEESWGASDREIMCIIYDAEPNTGTLAGAAR